MQFDIEREDFIRDQVFGLTCGVSVRTVEGRTGDLRDLTIRCDIRDADYPVSSRCIGGHVQSCYGSAEDLEWGSERLAVVDETVIVHRLLVRRDAAPPHGRATAFEAHGGLVDHVVGGGVGNLR